MRTAVIVAVLTMAFGTVVAYANVPANVVAQNGNQLSAIETERVENSFIHRADQVQNEVITVATASYSVVAGNTVVNNYSHFQVENTRGYVEEIGPRTDARSYQWMNRDENVNHFKIEDCGVENAAHMAEYGEARMKMARAANHANVDGIIGNIAQSATSSFI